MNLEKLWKYLNAPIILLLITFLYIDYNTRLNVELLTISDIIRALGLTALVATLISQRKEFKENRIFLKKSTEAQEAQTKLKFLEREHADMGRIESENLKAFKLDNMNEKQKLYFATQICMATFDINKINKEISEIKSALVGTGQSTEVNLASEVIFFLKEAKLKGLFLKTLEFAVYDTTWSSKAEATVRFTKIQIFIEKQLKEYSNIFPE